MDTDQTGKLILQRGEPSRKVTIIPMNQIKPFTVRDSVLKTAKDMVSPTTLTSCPLTSLLVLVQSLGH